MKLALLTTDNREYFHDFQNPTPYFGTAPEALLQGFAEFPKIDIHIVSCAQRELAAPSKLAENVWFHSLYVPKIGWLRTGYQGCIRAVRKKLKEIRPDIVHGQGTERDCAISAAFSGFPNVVTLHGIMQEQVQLFKARPGSFYWLAAYLEKFTLRRTAGVLCNSLYTEDKIRSLSLNTWRVPNALQEAFFSEPIGQRSSDKCILLNVGVVSARKQQAQLLTALRELQKEGLKFEMHFLGTLNRKDDYGNLFETALEENRSFASYVGFKSLKEVIRYYDKATALIHVPSEESFGLVVAEALARNLKFFGFRTGGISDIAEGVEQAELFRTDDWKSLKMSLCAWIQKGSPQPVSAADTMRARYHPRVIAQKHLDIYEEVLRTRS